MAVRTILICVLIALASTVVSAQPAPPSVGDRLRDGNAAAAAGDWPRVAFIVEPLFRMTLPRGDLAEAHRLAGLAAYFDKNLKAAENHFVSYLQIDLEGRLDPSLYLPDVVSFFQDVQVRHAGDLRSRRPKQKRSWLLNLIPPGGQIQNGEGTKAAILGGLIGSLAIANVSTFFLLRSWCVHVQGGGGNSITCDNNRDHASAASSLRTINLYSGVGLIIAYVYGVYDGVHGYRRRQREQSLLFIAPTTNGGVVGIGGSF